MQFGKRTRSYSTHRTHRTVPSFLASPEVPGSVVSGNGRPISLSNSTNSMGHHPPSALDNLVRSIGTESRLLLVRERSPRYRKPLFCSSTSPDNLCRTGRLSLYLTCSTHDFANQTVITPASSSADRTADLGNWPCWKVFTLRVEDAQRDAQFTRRVRHHSAEPSTAQ